MAKIKTSFVCQECGTPHSRWGGRCTGCGAWNTLVEEVMEKRPVLNSQNSLELVDLGGTTPPVERVTTYAPELDRVTGGGLVPGSVILLGGDPGIGKSTLLLQLAAHLPNCSYLSAEEGIEQIRLRARRLGLAHAPVSLGSTTSVEEIITHLESTSAPRCAIIDSIQTVTVEGLDGAAGTVGQVRAASAALIKTAKERNITLFLVGHVTKEGTLAGPRVLEHMVDTVLYFEGDRSQHLRLLRTVKNRFGPTNEIGVFEMTETGLRGITNPSALFVETHGDPMAGSAIFASVEGTRPLLVEIQALVTPTPFGMPRRTAVGWDHGRLATLLAVLEARVKVNFSNKDVYLNIAGGFRVQEPASDLAVAAALLSAVFDQPLPPKSLWIGEIGLSGDIRPASQTDLRLREGTHLGFQSAYLAARTRTDERSGNLSLYDLSHIRDLRTILNKERSTS